MALAIWHRIYDLRLVLWLFLCIYGPQPPLLSAQNDIESIEVYAVEEGLTNRIITDMTFDSRGLLWLATTSGLNLYDGYSFTNFLLSSNSNFHINDSYIADIEEVASQRLAIHYEYNLDFVDCYNMHTGETEKIVLNEANGIKGDVLKVGFQRFGSIYVLSKDSTKLYLHQLKQAPPFQVIYTAPLYYSEKEDDFLLYPTPQGNIWFNAPSIGLRCVDEKGMLQATYDLTDFVGAKEWNPATLIETIHEDGEGKTWLTFHNNSGVYHHSAGDSVFYLHPDIPADRTYHDIWEDRLGNLLFGSRKLPTTMGELFLLRKKGGVINLDNILDQEPLILSFLADDLEDYLLIGTYNGLYRVKFRNKDIRNYADTIPGYWGRTIKGITGDQEDRVFFAKETQWWYQLNRATDQLDTIWIIDPEDGQPLKLRNSTQLVYEDNHLWGTHMDTVRREGVLIHLDLASRRPQFYSYPQEIRSMIQARDGLLWMVVGSRGEAGQLIYFSPKEKAFTLVLDFSDTDLRSRADPTYLYEGRDGTFWIGTSRGLLCYRRSDKSHQVYAIGEEGPHNLSDDQILCIHEEPDGLIYIGTFGGGINVLDRQSGLVEVWNGTNGLANNNVCGILPAEDGDFWISTFNGLSFWNRKENNFRNFFIKDGLSHNEFNRYSFYQDVRGDYFFGNLNGVSSFKSEELLKEEESKALCLTRLTMYDSRKDALLEQTADLQNLKQIVLSPYITYFEIQFTLPDYHQPEKHQYQARLAGLEKNWNFLRNTPYLRYSSLDAGNYTLYLQGTTSGGKPANSVLQLDIIVQQIFYKTWWFRSLVLCAFLGLVYSFYRFRLERVVEVERLRTKIASDLHDEVGGIMTRISMGSDLLQEGLYSAKEQQRELKNIANQSRAVTGIMRDMIWSIDARQDKVKNLLDRMQEQLGELLPLADIKFNFETQGMILERELEVNVRQNVYLIFKEAINNIVKHSNATEVEVYMENSRKGFLLRIADNGSNGQGVSIQESGGQGLRNMRMRARRIDAEIELETERGLAILLRRQSLW